MNGRPAGRPGAGVDRGAGLCRTSRRAASTCAICRSVGRPAPDPDSLAPGGLNLRHLPQGMADTAWPASCGGLPRGGSGPGAWPAAAARSAGTLPVAGRPSVPGRACPSRRGAPAEGGDVQPDSRRSCAQPPAAPLATGGAIARDRPIAPLDTLLYGGWARPAVMVKEMSGECRSRASLSITSSYRTMSTVS